MHKVVIIGSGPAGHTAALYTSRANLEPIVIEGIEPGGQLTTTTDVENYPGFPDGIMGPDLVLKMREQAERFGAKYIQREVTGVAFSEAPFRMTLDDKSELEAQTVIISTGASAMYLGLDSEQKLLGHGVTSCATCDGAFYRDVPVAVIGGGDTAMEESLFLTRFASKVYVIHRRDEFRASKIMADRVLAHEKIEVLWDTLVEDVLDVEKNEVTGLKLKNAKTGAQSDLALEGVFIAIGHKPNTEPFRGQIDMDDRGYLLANNTRTNIPGVYAAGDVQDKEYRQAITAAGSGCMAALEAERYLESKGL
ncbi:MAG: thioredoxin-disulfide reductase [Verrucomicrobia bacterium]|nr:thioredoxin-disulfide reductase [Verrucomicrobiota bacterium]MDA1087128.1 thioredoxin-disulfide reductase [Verrucomicrobiota bacterium]